jgi:hypothetical protein
MTDLLALRAFILEVAAYEPNPQVDAVDGEPFHSLSSLDAGEEDLDDLFHQQEEAEAEVVTDER